MNTAIFKRYLLVKINGWIQWQIQTNLLKLIISKRKSNARKTLTLFEQLKKFVLQVLLSEVTLSTPLGTHFLNPVRYRITLRIYFYIFGLVWGFFFGWLVCFGGGQ